METYTWICATCGVEYEPGPQPPQQCPICEDERQYVPASGQAWNTAEGLAAEGRTVTITEVEPGLWGLRAAGVALAQTALLAVTGQGNLLLDVPNVIDDAAVRRVRELGGIDAILPSHPHMYGVQSAWSEAFDAPIWIAEADREWVGRWTPSMRTWTDPFEIVPGIHAEQLGGHFPGSAVALWRGGADGKGVLLAGDAIAPNDDNYVTFMRSYPNRIPLSAAVVRRIADQVKDWQYERIYANFGDVAGPDASARVQYSAQRYIDWVSGAYDHLT